MPVRVFLDSSVLISAVRGEANLRSRALNILSQPYFEFWYSPLLRLEVVPHATFNKQYAEVRFYEEYFRAADCYGDLDRMFEIGSREAERHGIPVMDALHVAAAHLARCRFLYTTEGTTKPMFRTKIVRVASILDTKKRRP